MEPQKRLVVLLERCDAVAPVMSDNAKPCPSQRRSPRVELVDCLSVSKSLDKAVKKKSGKREKRKKTRKKAEATVTARESELDHDSVDIQNEEMNVSANCSSVVETPHASEVDQPPECVTPEGKVETLERSCAPERMSIFDQMPLLLLENDDFFPAPEDPLLVDPSALLLGGGDGALVGETGSRNSSLLGEYPAVEFIHELNNDVMLGDVANQSALLEEEELLVVPGGAVSLETNATENVEFGQNDFAIDDEMEWSCDQAWPLLESGTNLPEGHGLLNSSLEAGDSDDDFGQRMREEFLARRLRCSTRLQNQMRRSADRSLSESDNLDSDSKIIVTRKRRREVPNHEVPNLAVPNLEVPNLEVPNLEVPNLEVPNLEVPSPEVPKLDVRKKSKMRRIRSKSNDKVVDPVDPIASKVELADGKTDAPEFPAASTRDDLEAEKKRSNSKEMDELSQKIRKRKERPSTEMKARTNIEITNSLLTSQNEAEKTHETKNSLRTSTESSASGKGARKSVDIRAEEATKKSASKAKENRAVPERASANDVILSKSLLNSVEAARQKYLSMKKEREATEPKESNSEEQKTRNAGKDAKNPCRQSGCSAPAGPGSIFCGSDCLSRHVAQSIKLLSQDRRMMYNRSQQPEKSGISDVAKATERIVVFERKTGKLVTGPLAPTESSLLTWLQRHPTFEVLQPEQALGNVSGNAKKDRRKLVNPSGRRNETEPRTNQSGVSSDGGTQRNNETKPGRSQVAVASSARSDSTSSVNASHSDERTELGEQLDPLRVSTRSELRHLFLERCDRNVSMARVKRLIIEIECELWSASRGSSTLYKQKLSGLVRIFKRSSSQDLCRRLLCAEMKPKQLLQQMRELQRSETTITKNSTVSPLDLVPGLVDTTSRHGEHIFDVSCRICSGRLTLPNDPERFLPPTSSDTACSLRESSLKPDASDVVEGSKDLEGNNCRIAEANATDVAKTRADEKVTQEEMDIGSSGGMPDAVVSAPHFPKVLSHVDSKCSYNLQSAACNIVLTPSQDTPPSSERPATIVPSPSVPSAHLSSDICPPGFSPGIRSPSYGISVGQIQVQKPSCKTSSGHSSLDLRPSNIPSGYLSKNVIAAPSVIELPPTGQQPTVATLSSPACPVTNVDQVPFASSPASVQTSAPCPSLSTCTSSSLTVTAISAVMSVETRPLSVQVRTPNAVRHSSATMLSPVKHSASDGGRSALERSSSDTVTSSRPQGLNRTMSSNSSQVHDTLVDLVWKGSLSALDGATMQLSAYRTSGSMKIVRSVLPATVTVMGRIDPKTVEDYLMKIRQQYTATREIAVICFRCHDDADKGKYNQLFNYLQDRRRCGVIGSISSAIKDMYIWPLPARTNIPPVLLPFNGPGLDVNRSDVLLGIIIQQQSRARGCPPKQPPPATPLHTSVANIKSAAKVTTVEPAPAAQDIHHQTPSSSSEAKVEVRASPTNCESSDEVSDDDLKALTQADPIVSKYSKARPQDLLVSANAEDDKPYDPFDEDYEMDSSSASSTAAAAAQNSANHEAEPMPNGHLQPTESIKHDKDVPAKPFARHRTSETTSETDQHPRCSSRGDQLERDERGNYVDLKASARDADVGVSSGSKRTAKASESSVSAQSNGDYLEAQLQDREQIGESQGVVLTGKSGEEIKSPGSSKSLRRTSKESQRVSPKALAVEADKALTMSGNMSAERGGLIADRASDAVGTSAGQQTSEQSPEASHRDSTSSETLTNIATVLSQLSEKNALNEDTLRSLLDQLLSVYGAQNDRQQRAILVQLVETLEKQHCRTEKQESAKERQQSMTEEQQIVAKNDEMTTVKSEASLGVSPYSMPLIEEQNGEVLEAVVQSEAGALLGKSAVDCVGPKASQEQNGTGREETVLKSPQIEESGVWPRHMQIPPKTSGADKESYSDNSKDSIAGSGILKRRESDYPAMYKTNIQSCLAKDESTQPARFDGYDADWFSTLDGREPACGVWVSEKRPRVLEVPPESLVPQETGELRSCMKKRKAETVDIDEPGPINIEKILPALSDSSFETLKSIVMSAKSVGVVPTKDPSADRLPQACVVEGQCHPTTADSSSDVSSDALFRSFISSSHPLPSPPLPVRPELSLLSPTFSNVGHLPAPPKPPPFLLEGTRFRSPIPDTFTDSLLPKAPSWMRICPARPSFPSPPIPERVDPFRNINPSFGNARLPFSPPWVSEGPPFYPVGHPRWSGPTPPRHGCLPGRSSHETAMDEWGYPLDNSRPRSLAEESRQFWQTNNYDPMVTAMRSQNNSIHEQCMADNRVRGMANAIVRADFSGKEMIERNFDHCHRDESRFRNMEPVPVAQPLFPGDEDYRQPFRNSSTKGLIASTYNDRDFRENSYEFFGSIPRESGSFGSLGELLPGLGDLLPGLGGLETTDSSERTVDLCEYPSSQTDDGNERTAEVEHGQCIKKTNALQTAVKTGIDEVLAVKIETEIQSETATLIGSDLKANLAGHSEFLSCNSGEMLSRIESSGDSEKATVETSPPSLEKVASSSNTDVDRGTHCDEETLTSKTAQETIRSPDAIASEDSEADEEEVRLAETLAGLHALIERCSKSKFERKSSESSVLLQESLTSNKTPDNDDDASLINDVGHLVKRCLDADLISYSEISGGIGPSLPAPAEKGKLVDSKLLPYVEMSCRGEGLGVNDGLRPCPVSQRCHSPENLPEVSSGNLNGGKSSDPGVVHSTEDPRHHGIDGDSNTATHINESGDCVIIAGSSDDSVLQWDVHCSEDPSQARIDGHRSTTPDRVVDDGSLVSPETCHDPGPSAELPTRGRTFNDRSRPRTDSFDSSDSVRIRNSDGSKRQLRDSYSSCDSSKKRRRRHGSERSRRDPSASKHSYRRDSSESGSYHGHRGSTEKRKRSHDSSGRDRKRTRRSLRDTDEEECDDLVFSSDESEEARSRRLAIYGRLGSYQSSESDSQRVRRKADAEDRLHSRIYGRGRKEAGQSTGRGIRPEISNGRHHHRDRRLDAIRYAGTRSPSESSDRTATSGERRLDRRSERRIGGERSGDVDKRPFHMIWKELELEERFNEEARCRNRNGDREEERCRRRRTEQTRDARSEKRSKRNDEETVGLAAFAGFISRRIPLDVDHSPLGASSGSKNLVVDVGLNRRPSISQDSGAGQRRHGERLERAGSLVTDAVLADSVSVGSSPGRGRQRTISNRDSAERKESARTEPVNSGQGTAVHSTGHPVVSDHSLPNGQRTPLVAIPSKAAQHPHRTHRQSSSPSPRHPGVRRSHASPRKPPVNANPDEELEEGEIVDRELPSSTRDLLALLNAPISWVNPAAVITRAAGQQPDPSKT